MGSETLSQNEIDALLGGGGGAAHAVSPAAVPAAVLAVDAQIYDFKRPHRVSKDKLRTLEAMYDRFAKALESWLHTRVRGNLQLALQSVEQYSFAEFTLSLPTPCASFIFEIDGSAQQGVIDMGGDFAFFLVDRLFGGSGDPIIMNRALTPIERMAVRTVAERALHQLVESWADYLELHCSLTGFESIPEILRAANPEDPVLVANIEVTAGQTRSLLVVCLPFVILEKFFAGGERRVTSGGSASEQAASREVTERSLRSTRVPLAARLPSFRLSLRQLKELKAGSVLTTGVPRDAALEVFVGTQVRFHAAPGRVGGSLALRLLDRILPSDGGTNSQSS